MDGWEAYRFLQEEERRVGGWVGGWLTPFSVTSAMTMSVGRTPSWEERALRRRPTVGWWVGGKERAYLY